MPSVLRPANRQQGCVGVRRKAGGKHGRRACWQGRLQRRARYPESRPTVPLTLQTPICLAEQASRLLVSTFAARSITATDPDQPSPTHEH
jgi:hypothetical protein